MILPDKHIRKAIFEALAGMIVDTKEIPTYDTYATTDCPDCYVIMSNQSNAENKANKCDSRYNSNILIDCITRYPGPGNTGSRLLADNIAQEVLNRVEGMQIDPVSELQILTQTITTPNDITVKTPTENVFRKLIRLDFQIGALPPS